MTTLVLALAGTDHHPFDRMVDWIDDAASRRPEVRFLIQHGATRAPRIAHGQDYFAHDRLAALLGEAAVVICHGGPGLIMEAREAGHVPLCLPRDPRLGEHVDSHQQRFAAVVADAGVVRPVASLEDFHTQIDVALSDRAQIDPAQAFGGARDAARARLAAELDRLIAPARPVRPSRRFRARVGV